MTLRAFDVDLHGTGTPTASGLSITFLDAVPLQVTSGTHVIDYRVSNSTGSAITFSGIAAKVYGNARGKMNVTLGHSSLNVPAGGSVDSTITIEVTSNLLRGEISKIVISGDASAAASDFTATITASRTTGQAPLSIMFDCLSTTGHSGDLYHECICEWSFPGASSMQSLTGQYVWAVYETAGTYTASVTVYCPDGTVGLGSLEFTVDAWTGTLRYINSASSAGGDGTTNATSGANRAYNNLADAMAGSSNTTSRKFVVAGGHSETVSADANPASGSSVRFILEKGGTGADPIFIRQGQMFSSPNGAEVFLSHCQFRGYYDPTSGTSPWTTTSTVSNTNHFFGGESFSYLTVHESSVSGWYRFMSGDGSSGSGKSCIIGSDIAHSPYYHWIYGRLTSNDNWAFGIVDSTIRNSSTSGGQAHIRTGGYIKYYLGEVVMSGHYGTAGHQFRLNGQANTGGATISRHAYLWRVTFGDSTTTTAFTDFGPQNSSTADEERQDVVLDSCTFLNDDSGQECMRKCSVINFTVRNCVGIGGASCNKFVEMGRQGTYPTNTAWGTQRFIGNSFYTTHSSPMMVDSTSLSSNGPGAYEFYNNAMHAPNGDGSSYMFSLSDPMSEVTHADNIAKFSSASSTGAHYLYTTSTDLDFNAGSGLNGSLYDNPDFTSSSDLHLQAGSPCIGAGTALGSETRKDRDGVLRGAAIDVGAYEYVA